MIVWWSPVACAFFRADHVCFYLMMYSEGKIVSKLKKAAQMAKDSVVKEVPLIAIDDVSEEGGEEKAPLVAKAPAR